MCSWKSHRGSDDVETIKTFIIIDTAELTEEVYNLSVCHKSSFLADLPLDVVFAKNVLVYCQLLYNSQIKMAVSNEGIRF